MEKKILSLVIPSYNRAQLIMECINSCLSQSSPDWEIITIIIDDGSTDGTFEKVAKIYDFSPTAEGFLAFKQHLFLRRIANSERGAARNCGAQFAIDHLKTEWILFLDADDVLTPGALDKVLRDLDTNARLVSAKYLLWDGTNTWGQPAPPSPPLSFSLDLFLSGNPLALGTTLVYHSLFKSVGGFSEDRQMSGSEDWVFLFKCAALGSVQILEHVMVLYRRHEGNTSPQRTEKALQVAMQELIPFVTQTYVEKAPWAILQLQRHQALMTIGAYNSNRQSKASLALWLQLVSRDPRALATLRTWRTGASVVTRMFGR